MIERLEWDSEFFGFGIAEWRAKGSPVDLTELNESARRQNISLIQAKVPIDDLDVINDLENNGFHFVDLKISFLYGIGEEISGPTELAVADTEDLSQITEMATSVFRKSRFFRPPFEEWHAMRFFATWAQRAVLGHFDDECLKLANGAEVMGFITVKHLPSNRARVGLLGVAPKHQDKGIGTALLKAAQQHLQRRGVRDLAISTQGANVSAQNLFISTGARITEVESWYYRIIT